MHTPQQPPAGTPTRAAAVAADAPGSAPAAEPAIRAIGLVKTYGEGDARVRPLDGLTLDIAAGSFTAIMGPSGSGKSTLLNMLAGLDVPDAGDVILAGTPITGLKDSQLTALRRDRIGFVFQAFNLVPAMTAEENILLPSQLAGRKVDRRFFHRIVDLLGLTDRLRHRPHELSGGQQQRVAVARALVTSPEVIVADEPTGNLDSASGAEVLGLLRASVDEFGQTVVMVTHDPQAAARADRVVMLADGRLAGELRSPTAEAVATALAHITTQPGTTKASTTQTSSTQPSATQVSPTQPSATQPSPTQPSPTQAGGAR